MTGTYNTLERYWNDPTFRAEVEAERAKEQRRMNRDIDEAKIRAGVRWPADWTEKEKYEASAHLRGADQ